MIAGTAAQTRKNQLWQGSTLPTYGQPMKFGDRYRLFRFTTYWETQSEQKGDTTANTNMIEYMPRVIRDYMQPLFQANITTKQAIIILISLYEKDILKDADSKIKILQEHLHFIKQKWITKCSKTPDWVLPANQFIEFLFEAWASIALDLHIMSITGVPNNGKSREYAFTALHRITGIGSEASSWLLEVTDIDQHFELLKLVLTYGSPRKTKQTNVEQTYTCDHMSLMRYYYPIEVHQCNPDDIADPAVRVWSHHQSLTAKQAQRVVMQMVLQQVQLAKTDKVILRKMTALFQGRQIQPTHHHHQVVNTVCAKTGLTSRQILAHVFHIVMQENDTWYQNVLLTLKQCLDNIGWGPENRPKLLAWLALCQQPHDQHTTCPCGCTLEQDRPLSDEPTLEFSFQRHVITDDMF